MRKDPERSRKIIAESSLSQREKDMVIAAIAGETGASIAVRYGIGAQRAGQIIKGAAFRATREYDTLGSDRGKLNSLNARGRKALLALGAKCDADVVALWDGGRGAAAIAEARSVGRTSFENICDVFGFERPDLAKVRFVRRNRAEEEADTEAGHREPLLSLSLTDQSALSEEMMNALEKEIERAVADGELDGEGEQVVHVLMRDVAVPHKTLIVQCILDSAPG